MQAFQIEIGGEYGFRENPLRVDKLQRVRVLQHVRKKWKVQWIHPIRGIVDYMQGCPRNWSSLGKSGVPF